MRCRNCGWENADGALRCMKCNQPLTPSMAAPPQPRPAPRPAAPSPAQPSPYRFTVLDARAGMPMPGPMPTPPPAPAPEPPKPTLPICPNCRYPATDYSDACPNCGTRLVAPAPAPAPANPYAQQNPYASATGPRLIPVDGGPVIQLRPGTFIEIGYHKYRFEL